MPPVHADGVDPSNEGRGYVLRRIMRRAMRHAQLLGAREPLMWRLVPGLVREMGQAFPELVAAEERIAEILRLEETRFRVTLARGLSMLEDETRTLTPGATLSGDVAFRLYDTFGFPLDLTQEALRAREIKVDDAGFASAMARQKADARKAWSGSGEAATETVWFGLKEDVGATEFLGYGTETAEGVVMALVRDGQPVEALSAGESGFALLNQTPFYAESGGQLGDSGTMTGPGSRVQVTDTLKKLGDLFVHAVTVEDGRLAKGAAVELAVDHARRGAIRANHSATHLLHEALRQVLGPHVAQKGSLVGPERLRFDFSHQKPMTDAEIEAVENLANAVVLRNEAVVTRLMGIDEARASGARALFGEKYGDEVRVVSMGTVENEGGGAKPYSIELCGGTHASRTGNIGLVTLVGESAVSAGVRRLEAKTGDAARQHLNAESRRLQQAAALLKAPADTVPERLATLVEERRRLERDLSEARKRLAMAGGGTEAPAARDVAGVGFFARAVTGVEMKDLKGLADEAKGSLGSGIVAIVGVGADGKAGVVVSVSKDLVGRFNAIDFVRVGSEALGGKGGGGRPDMAQAGGPNGAAAEAALEAIGRALEQAATATAA